MTNRLNCEFNVEYLNFLWVAAIETKKNEKQQIMNEKKNK